MNCRGVSRRLSAYIDNDLSPGIRQSVEEHLEHCVPCKRQLSEFETILVAAQNLPLLSVTDDFGARVVNAIHSHQETQEVLGALRYRFTIAGVAFMVTSAAVFFLIGPPSTKMTATFSGARDSLMQESIVAPDFYLHPETKVPSFPLPEGNIPQQATGNDIVPNDSTARIDEFVLPDIQRVKENVSDKF
jgi:hypothetical protein